MQIGRLFVIPLDGLLRQLLLRVFREEVFQQIRQSNRKWNVRQSSLFQFVSLLLRYARFPVFAAALIWI